MPLCLLTSQQTFLHLGSTGNNDVIASLPCAICCKKDHHVYQVTVSLCLQVAVFLLPVFIHQYMWPVGARM